MKDLKKLVNPFGLIGVIIGFVVLFMVWNRICSTSYKIQSGLKIIRIQEQNIGYLDQLSEDEIREKIDNAYEKKLNNEVDHFSEEEKAYMITTFPTLKEVGYALTEFDEEKEKIDKERAAFEEKTKAINADRVAKGQEPIEYSGKLSALDTFESSTNRILKSWLLAIIVGGSLVG